MTVLSEKPTYWELEKRVEALASERDLLRARLDSPELFVTQRKQTEEKLRESEAKYRDLVENINDVIYTVDESGRISYISPRIEAVMGYPPEEVVGRPFVDFIFEEDLPRIIAQFKKILAGRVEPSEYRLVGKSGETRCVRTSSRQQRKGGRIVGIGGSMVDITEAKRLEDQLRQTQKMEAVGTLAGGIAHDFNNILGIILGSAELAIDDVPEWNPASGFLREIRSACLRAKDVVRQLLVFSRKSEERMTPLDIAPVVRESVKMLRATIPSSIELNVTIDEDLRPIRADTTQINQVLLNLAANAADAMEDEGGRLTIRLQNAAVDQYDLGFGKGLPPGEYVRLRVMDTGRGIPTENLERIFEPYFTTKDVGKGTGMGLSVVHGIVHRHGGVIKVRSRVGEGTVFDLCFPALEAVVPPGERNENDQEPAKRAERILFVDDEASMVSLNRQRLERLGYTVRGTTDPLEALALFQSDPDQFDVMITDMTMPKMTGDRLAQECLKMRPNMPIIICTGYSERISEARAAQLNIRKYVEKPIEANVLAAAVREVLDRNRQDTVGGRAR